MIGLAITLFSQHSIIWGLIVLFIGTPIVIALASYFFIFFLILIILALIIWGVTYLFGFDIAFSSVWDGIWLIIRLLIVGGLGYFLVSGFLISLQKSMAVYFFKKNWFSIILFIVIFWLFFLVR